MTQRGYFRHPTVQADRVVFVCEDDLWTVSTHGGTARRLTAGSGECSFPRLSPDGKWIAFVGREEGHPEVYVMPSDGGKVKRLTYMASFFCQISGWSPDGREILFVSDAKSPFVKHMEVFAVPYKGGEPRPYNLGHAHSLSVSTKGLKAIGRNNSDPARWKRYKGGTAGEIWIESGRRYEKFTDIEGNIVWPMWVGSRVFFLSDHEGVANIYSAKPDGKNLKRHTNHSDYFARYPSTDGKRIVYTSGADIYLLDTKTDKTSRIKIETPEASPQIQRKFVAGQQYLECFSIDPRGQSLALISRGQPFTMPFWEGAVLQHGEGSRIRYRLSEWLSDGKRFVVVNDRPGFDQLEVHHADQGRAPVKVRAGQFGRAVEMSVSPVADKVAIANHRYELYLVDLVSRKAKVLDDGSADRITGLSWSPDGRYLAYSWSPQMHMRIIRIVDVRTGTIRDITDPLRSDRRPCFDPEGNYLHFLSNRDFHPVYDALQFELSFPEATRPFLVTLRKDVPSPFSPEPKPFVKKAEQKVSSAKTKAKAVKSRKKVPAPVKIDFDGIEKRIVGFPVKEGDYRQIVAVPGRLLYTKFPVKGIRPGGSPWDEDDAAGTLFAYDFEEQREAVLQRGVFSVRLAADTQTLVYRAARRRLRVVDAREKLPSGTPSTPSDTPGRKSGWIDLGRVSVLVQPALEWAQMFDETWRLQEEHFWDEYMTQVDWDLVYNRYVNLLPRVRTRSELSDLIWEMQGELGTSHAYEMGGDYRPSRSYLIGCLGAEFAFDRRSGGYKITRIIRGDSWLKRADSPLARPGLGVKAGDVITKVGGIKVSENLPVGELLMNNVGREVALTIRDSKGKSRTIVVETMRDEGHLRYRDWVETNRKYVHDKTRGRIGYVHIPDMGPWGFAEFHRNYLSESHRDGLIVDVRYNRGGHVSPLLLEKLARKRVGYDVPRWGAPEPYPPESIIGPIVAVTNQFAGSDGDIFSHCFKLYKLGPLIGTRTWGGVIGIWPRHRLVDGTVTTQPEFSFWFKDVGWQVENYGTDPDIEVEYAPHHYRQGNDPQLDRAIKIIRESLKKNPPKLPNFKKQRPDLSIPDWNGSKKRSKRKTTGSRR